MFCLPPKKRGFDKNRRKFRIAFYPPKRDFAPQTPEVDENGGCHPGRMTVCQKHHFDITPNKEGKCPESPFSMCSPAEKGDFFERKLPFTERGERGVLGPRDPLFQEMGVQATVIMRENSRGIDPKKWP